MSALPVPPAYDARLTAPRGDLTTLRACWREFRRRYSPRAIALALALALGGRILVGRWSWRDALVPPLVLAAQPFVEWVIHRYLLHLPALELFGRRVELYGAIQHRRHHRDPNDLERILLRGVEVRGFLAEIPAALAPVSLAYATLTGGRFLPLWLTGTVLCYLGLLRYEWSHFLIHTPYRPRSRWYRTIHRNHRLHHYKHEGYWLGVSSNLGDRLLGTNPDQRAVPRSPTARTLGGEASGAQAP